MIPPTPVEVASSRDVSSLADSVRTHVEAARDALKGAAMIEEMKWGANFCYRFATSLYTLSRDDMAVVELQRAADLLQEFLSVGGKDPTGQVKLCLSSSLSYLAFVMSRKPTDQSDLSKWVDPLDPLRRSLQFSDDTFKTCIALNRCQSTDPPDLLIRLTRHTLKSISLLLEDGASNSQHPTFEKIVTNFATFSQRPPSETCELILAQIKYCQYLERVGSARGRDSHFSDPFFVMAPWECNDVLLNECIETPIEFLKSKYGSAAMSQSDKPKPRAGGKKAAAESRAPQSCLEFLKPSAFSSKLSVLLAHQLDLCQALCELSHSNFSDSENESECGIFIFHFALGLLEKAKVLHRMCPTFESLNACVGMCDVAVERLHALLDVRSDSVERTAADRASPAHQPAIDLIAQANVWKGMFIRQRALYSTQLPPPLQISPPPMHDPNSTTGTLGGGGDDHVESALPLHAIVPQDSLVCVLPVSGDAHSGDLHSTCEDEKSEEHAKCLVWELEAMHCFRTSIALWDSLFSSKSAIDPFSAFPFDPRLTNSCMALLCDVLDFLGLSSLHSDVLKICASFCDKVWMPSVGKCEVSLSMARVSSFMARLRLVEFHSDMGQSSAAEQHLSKMSSLASAAMPSTITEKLSSHISNVISALTCYARAQVHSSNGDLERADEEASRAFEQLTALKSVPSSLIARADLLVSALLARRGSFDRCLARCLSSLSARLCDARCLSSNASTAESSEKGTVAGPSFALLRFEMAHGQLRFSEWTVLSGTLALVAKMHDLRGSHRESEMYLIEGLRFAQSTRCHSFSSDFLSSLSALHIRRRDNDRALSFTSAVLHTLDIPFLLHSPQAAAVSAPPSAPTTSSLNFHAHADTLHLAISVAFNGPNAKSKTGGKKQSGGQATSTSVAAAAAAGQWWCVQRSQALVALGDVYRRSGKLEKSLAEYQRACETVESVMEGGHVHTQESGPKGFPTPRLSAALGLESSTSNRSTSSASERRSFVPSDEDMRAPVRTALAIAMTKKGRALILTNCAKEGKRELQSAIELDPLPEAKAVAQYHLGLYYLRKHASSASYSHDSSPWCLSSPTAAPANGNKPKKKQQTSKKAAVMKAVRSGGGVAAHPLWFDWETCGEGDGKDEEMIGARKALHKCRCLLSDAYRFCEQVQIPKLTKRVFFALAAALGRPNPWSTAYLSNLSIAVAPRVQMTSLLSQKISDSGTQLPNGTTTMEGAKSGSGKVKSIEEALATLNLNDMGDDELRQLLLSVFSPPQSPQVDGLASAALHKSLISQVSELLPLNAVVCTLALSPDSSFIVATRLEKSLDPISIKIQTHDLVKSFESTVANPPACGATNATASQPSMDSEAASSRVRRNSTKQFSMSDQLPSFVQSTPPTASFDFCGPLVPIQPPLPFSLQQTLPSGTPYSCGLHSEFDEIEISRGTTKTRSGAKAAVEAPKPTTRRSTRATAAAASEDPFSFGGSEKSKSKSGSARPKRGAKQQQSTTESEQEQEEEEESENDVEVAEQPKGRGGRGRQAATKPAAATKGSSTRRGGGAKAVPKEPSSSESEAENGTDGEEEEEVVEVVTTTRSKRGQTASKASTASTVTATRRGGGRKPKPPSESEEEIEEEEAEVKPKRGAGRGRGKAASSKTSEAPKAARGRGRGGAAAAVSKTNSSKGEQEESEGSSVEQLSLSSAHDSESEKKDREQDYPDLMEVDSDQPQSGAAEGQRDSTEKGESSSSEIDELSVSCSENETEFKIHTTMDEPNPKKSDRGANGGMKESKASEPKHESESEFAAWFVPDGEEGERAKFLEVSGHLDDAARAYARLVGQVRREFDSILAASAETTSRKLSDSAEDRRDWWNARKALDVRMRSLQVVMECVLLAQWKCMVLGTYEHSDEALTEIVNDVTLELQSFCDERPTQWAVDPSLVRLLVSGSPHLSEFELKSALREVLSTDGLEDIDWCVELIRTAHGSLVSSLKGISPSLRRKHVILILDKQLQSLPWESLPLFEGRSVSRMPSLLFVLANLLKSRASMSPSVSPDGGAATLARSVDLRRTFYVLNPGGDLTNTQQTFQSWLESQEWDGVVGRPPSGDQLKSALEANDLFLYMGHGSGEQYLRGDHISKLRRCAAAILMGCSSGVLVEEGDYEPAGIALCYLLAECPCVVGNLWDVTDRDIDRLSEELLKQWTIGESSTPTTTSTQKQKQAAHSSEPSALTDVLSKARAVCRLRYLTGSAPVVYGVPIHPSDQ